mgnify:CR=1 FL=1
MDDSTQTQRVLPFPPGRVYAAFEDAGTLATWWGPDGFRNERVTMDFRVGGAWTFDMVGPDGTRYTGQTAVRAFWAEFFASSPHARFTGEDMFAAGDRCPPSSVRWRPAYSSTGSSAASCWCRCRSAR